MREPGNRRQDGMGRGRPGGGRPGDGQGGNRPGGGRPGGGRPGDGKHSSNRLPDRLEELPYMTPTMVAQLRRAGVHTPSDMRGRSGDQIYAALQKSYGEQPHHTVLYVLRAISHFVRTGERKDWREFTDIGHKRRPPERGQRPPGPFGTHPRSGSGSGRRPPRRPPH